MSTVFSVRSKVSYKYCRSVNKITANYSSFIISAPDGSIFFLVSDRSI